MKGNASLFFFLVCLPFISSGQIKGIVKEKDRGPVIGAVIYQKGSTNATTSDENGRFELVPTGQAPYRIVVTYTGFVLQEIETDGIRPIEVNLVPQQIELKDVEITGSRISEKQKVAPLTVESMDLISIKEIPQKYF
jgi:hypothetical protein